MIACSCTYCGCPLFRRVYGEEWTGIPVHMRATMDHVIPKGKGGKDLLNNTVPACASCNVDKGCLTGEEYGAVLAFRSGHKELFKLWYTKFREEKYV